jgi:N-methylhydantoinase B
MAVRSDAVGAPTQQFDPFTVEIILDGLYAAAREMFLTLGRTSKSPIIYEVLDYACGVYSPDAELIAQDNGVTGFLGTLHFTVKEVLEKFTGRIEPGDMFITNDPWASNGSHLSDVNLVYPIFEDQDLVALGVNKAHWTEIGGKDPGSWSADATEVFQEGLLFPCVHLYRRGELNQALVDLIEANVRTPDDTLGDLHAQAASLRVGGQRVVDLCRKYGTSAVRAAMREHVRRGTERALRAMAELPQGTFEVADVMENDMAGRVPIPVHLKLTISGDEFIVDVSGNPGPVASAINGTAVGVKAQARTVFKIISDPHGPVNEGNFAPVRVVAPEGTIFTAPRPAAVSVHWEYKSIFGDMIYQALAEHLPQRIPAAHQLSTCASIIDGKREGGEYWLVVEPQLGGWGASAYADGQQGQHPVGNGETYNLPMEVIETRYPILMERYGFDTEHPAGAGRHRGGLGVVKEYRILNPSGGHVTATFGRHHRPPWGVAGGQPGSPNRIEIVPNGQETPSIRTGTLARHPLRRGDLVRFVTATGGGWGDPLARDPSEVAEDVKNGYIFAETALQSYGVVIDPASLAVDEAATLRVRQARQGGGPAAGDR